jgi:cell division protein FtsQ
VKTEKNILLKDIQRRKRRKSLVLNSLAIGGALALFTLLGFVHQNQKSKLCWKLDIQLDAPDGKAYLNQKVVSDLAHQAVENIEGEPIDKIDIKAIHNKILENSIVKEAYVYTSVDGRCVVQVKQRTPIARIFNEDGSSFYLDKDGFTMALSNYYTAKVPVFVGNIHEKMQSTSILDHAGDQGFLAQTKLDDIYTFTKFIDENEFWKAQVEHVHINSAGDFEIIPRMGNHKINIGDCSELAEKFKKLMAFYANTVHSKDLNDYSSIHLEYDGQVVCVKRMF